jgi:hypothetical protein
MHRIFTVPAVCIMSICTVYLKFEYKEVMIAGVHLGSWLLYRLAENDPSFESSGNDSPQTCIGSRRSSVILVLASWHSGNAFAMAVGACCPTRRVTVLITWNTTKSLTWLQSRSSHSLHVMTSVTSASMISALYVICRRIQLSLPIIPLKLSWIQATLFLMPGRDSERWLMCLEKLKLNVNPALKLEAVFGESLMWTLRLTT